MSVSRLLGGLGRPFGWLWGSYALANLADGIVLVGFPLIAVQLTRSPVLVAATTATFTLPWFLFGLLAGVLADRLDRRALMLYANVPRVVVLVLLAIAAWQDMLTLPMLYAGAFVLGTAEALFDTPGQAILPMVVDRTLFRRANSRLLGSRIVMNEFVGAPVAGALVGLVVAAALVAPAMLYAAAPLCLLFLKGRFVPRRKAGSTIRTEIREGLTELRCNKLVRTLAVYSGMVNLVGAAFTSVFVLYAVGASSALQLPESAYGLLLVASAVGATAGSLGAERLDSYAGTRMLLIAGTVAVAVSYVVPAAVPNLFAAAAALFVNGLCIATLGVISLSLRQEIVPEQMLGRVGASFRLIAFGTRPVGAILGGIIAAAIGLRPLFLVCAATVLLVVPLLVRIRVPERQHGSAPI